jgi:hypothetical protein
LILREELAPVDFVETLLRGAGDDLLLEDIVVEST